MKKFLAGLMSIALVVMLSLSLVACGETDRHHEYDGKAYELSEFVFLFQMKSSYVDPDTSEVVTSYMFQEVSMEDMLKYIFCANNGIEQGVAFTDEQEEAYNKYKANFIKEFIKYTSDDEQFNYSLKFEDGKAVFAKNTFTKLAGKDFNINNVKSTMFDYELQENDFSSITMIKTNEDGTSKSISGFVKLEGYDQNTKNYNKLTVKKYSGSGDTMGIGCTDYNNDFYDQYSYSGIVNRYITGHNSSGEYGSTTYTYLGYSEVYTLVG